MWRPVTDLSLLRWIVEFAGTAGEGQELNQLVEADEVVAAASSRTRVRIVQGRGGAQRAVGRAGANIGMRRRALGHFVVGAAAMNSAKSDRAE